MDTLGWSSADSTILWYQQPDFPVGGHHSTLPLHALCVRVMSLRFQEWAEWHIGWSD